MSLAYTNGAPREGAGRQAHSGKDQSAELNRQNGPKQPLSRGFDQYEIKRKPGTVSPGRVLLLRAAVYHDQVERGEMSELQAFESLAPGFFALMHPLCPCDAETFQRMERLHPPRPAKPRRGRT